MTEIKDLGNNIYWVKCEQQIPYFISVDKRYIRITQPNYTPNGKINPNEYFGKLYPQEIIITLDCFAEFFSALNKIIVMERINETDKEEQ